VTLFAFALPSGATVWGWSVDEASARASLRRQLCKERRHWADSPRHLFTEVPWFMVKP
jgi:hypothetical protein